MALGHVDTQSAKINITHIVETVPENEFCWNADRPKNDRREDEWVEWLGGLIRKGSLKVTDLEESPELGNGWDILKRSKK